MPSTKPPRKRINALNRLDDHAWELILSRLAPEPCYLACAALACKRFAEIATGAWKHFCRWTAPDIVKCYEDAGKAPPGGWRTLYKVLVWCPGANWPEKYFPSGLEVDERSHVQLKVPSFSLEKSRLCLQEALREDKLWLSLPSCEHDIDYDTDEPAPPAYYRGLFFDFSNSATWKRCKEKPIREPCPFCQQEAFELGYVHNEEEINSEGVPNTTCLSSEAPGRLHCEGYQGSTISEAGVHAWYGESTYAVVCKAGHVTGGYFDGYVYCKEGSDCEDCQAGEFDGRYAPWDCRDRAFEFTYTKRCLKFGDLRTMFSDDDLNLRTRVRKSKDSTASPKMMKFLEEVLQAGREDDLSQAMEGLKEEVEEAMERVYTDAAQKFEGSRAVFQCGYGKANKQLEKVVKKAEEAIQVTKDYDAGKRVKRRIKPGSEECESDLEHWLHIWLSEDISKEELRTLLLPEGKGITRIDLEPDENGVLCAYVGYPNLAAAMVAWKNLTRLSFQLQGKPASVAFWPDRPRGLSNIQKLKYKLCAEEKAVQGGHCSNECSPKCPHGRCEACCQLYTESEQLPLCEDHLPACDKCLANLLPAEVQRCREHLCAACCTSAYCSLHCPPKVPERVGHLKCTHQGCNTCASKKCKNVSCKQHCTPGEICKYHHK